MNYKNIKIESISKNYSDLSGHTLKVFENISFNIETGKVTTLLAQPKKGKTSLLKVVANIDKPKNISNGKRIFIPKKSSSFPWLNVRQNILFNLNKTDKNILKDVIKFVELSGYEDHFPNNNSVGFRFRISLARAIINNPELIIIDESISNLPIQRKFDLYSLIRKVACEKGIPILFATSSISEAIRISDIVLFFNHFTANQIIKKPILIDEESRVDNSALFNIQDYFTDEEIQIFNN